MLKRRVVAAVRAFREPPFVDAGHFYSPIAGADERATIARRNDAGAPPAEIPGVRLDVDAQLALLEKMLPLATDLPWTAGPDPTGALRFHYENRNYEYSDAIFYASVLRHFQPRRVVEIGSGYTSALALDVNERYLDGRMELTFVEPYPEDRLLRITDQAELGTRLIPERVQDVDPSLYATLEANDILFIDSTHVSRTGSDVNQLFFEVLPTLAPGVLVHVHDVFYPFEYPSDWLRAGKAWNEDYLLRAFLQYNDAFEVVLFNTYLQSMRPEWFEQNLPECLKNTGGSIWLRRLG